MYLPGSLHDSNSVEEPHISTLVSNMEVLTIGFSSPSFRFLPRLWESTKCQPRDLLWGNTSFHIFCLDGLSSLISLNKCSHVPVKCRVAMTQAL